VRSRTLEAELAYELVAARADLERIVKSVRVGADEPAVRTLQGWRRELVGAELLELLQGRLRLRLDSNRRLAVEPAE
jgi:ribonuclease D